MKSEVSLIKRFITLLFWLGFIATAIVTLMPNQNIPTSVLFWDKAQHGLAFFMLMLTGATAYTKQIKFIIIGLILYGASIEVMQEYFTTTRHGDIYDLVADGIGVLLGWLGFLIVVRFTHPKKPSL